MSSSSLKKHARVLVGVVAFACLAHAGAQTQPGGGAPASGIAPGRYMMSFVSGGTGQPLSNVQVRLRRHGRVLVEFKSSGPRCLFSVPDASYRIEGTYAGATQFAVVETGALTTQLKW